MSDSSDSEVPVKKQDKKHSKKAAAVPAPTSEDFMIKPEKGIASVDTASWPLLLKVNFTFITVLLL